MYHSVSARQHLPCQIRRKRRSVIFVFKTMKTLFAVLVMCATATTISAQLPKDVEGWREAKWGMTKNQVIQAFRGEVKQGPPIKVKHGFIDGLLRIENFTVKG